MIEDFVSAGALLGPAVYCLIAQGTVVYVGQSRRPLNRIYTHAQAWQRKQRGKPWPWARTPIQFDDVWIRPCAVEHLADVEWSLIEAYKPKYNKVHKRPGKITVPITLRVGQVTLTLNGARGGPVGLVRRI